MMRALTPKTLFTKHIAAIVAVGGLLAVTATTATAGKTPPKPNPAPFSQQQQLAYRLHLPVHLRRCQINRAKEARAKGWGDLARQSEELAGKFGALANSANPTQIEFDHLRTENDKLNAAYKAAEARTAPQRQLAYQQHLAVQFRRYYIDRAKEARAKGWDDLARQCEELAGKFRALANNANPTQTELDHIRTENNRLDAAYRAAKASTKAPVSQGSSLLQKVPVQLKVAGVQQQQESTRLRAEVARLQAENKQLKRTHSNSDDTPKRQKMTEDSEAGDVPQAPQTPPGGWLLPPP